MRRSWNATARGWCYLAAALVVGIGSGGCVGANFGEATADESPQPATYMAAAEAPAAPAANEPANAEDGATTRDGAAEPSRATSQIGSTPRAIGGFDEATTYEHAEVLSPVSPPLSLAREPTPMPWIEVDPAAESTTTTRAAAVAPER